MMIRRSMMNRALAPLRLPPGASRLLPAVTTPRAQLLAIRIALVALYYPAWPRRPLDLSYVWRAYTPLRGLR